MTSDWQYEFRDLRSLNTKIFNQSEPHCEIKLNLQGAYIPRLSDVCSSTPSYWSGDVRLCWVTEELRENSYIPWTTAFGPWLLIKVSRETIAYTNTMNKCEDFSLHFRNGSHNFCLYHTNIARGPVLLNKVWGTLEEWEHILDVHARRVVDATRRSQ